MSWLRDVDRWLCAEVLPHQYAFVALATRLTGDAEIAKDVVHDVYAEVLDGEEWRQALSPKAFVMRIVYCRSLDWVRKQRIVPLQPMPSFESLLFADTEPNAFSALSDKEELAAVLEMMRDLPKQCSQVVMMRRIEEVPPREIAKRLGLSLSTVEKHLARGLTLLAEKLGQQKVSRRGDRQVMPAKSEGE